jgi:phosphoglycolate phosphatase-like HAD superfamily hydrolase
MSKKTLNIPEVSDDTSSWACLLEEAKAEIRASNDLSDEEKRLLEELDRLPEEEWNLGVCSGKPISETIIEDRGER